MKKIINNVVDHIINDNPEITTGCAVEMAIEHIGLKFSDFTPRRV